MATQETAQNESNLQMKDPFAAQRGEDDKLGEISPTENRQSSTSPTEDRRMSLKEWDASKVPPSQFQKRKGSIYSTPNSRDGHVKGTTRDKAYHDKIKEKGWGDKKT